VGIADESNLELLRKKAVVLESENERLSKRMSELLHENMNLRGMTPQAIEKNLPGLLEQATAGGASSGVTRPGNEGRPRDKPKTKDEPQTGHGPTDQPELELVHETFDVDEPVRQCTACGGELDIWEGAEDEVEVIESVERKWVVKKCKLTKYRCKCGGCVVTADGPTN
jgi:transposase